MRKLLLAAVLLLAVCAWAQVDYISMGEVDTTAIKMTVHMVGAKWSLDTLADGWGAGMDDVMPAWQYIVDADMDTHRAVQADADSVEPCDDIVGAFWAENRGGVALDLEAKYKYVGPDWSIHATAFSCAGAFGTGVNDVSALNLVYMDANGIVDDNVATDYNANTVITNAFQEFDNPTFRSPSQPYAPSTATGTNLYAEDPVVTGDGTFGDQIDQIEIYLDWIIPASSTTTADQSIIVVLRGAIMD